MKKLAMVFVFAVVVSVFTVVGSGTASGSQTVACTANTPLSSPVTSTVWCATPHFVGVGPSDVVTGKVTINGTGVTGGIVKVQRGVTTSPFSDVRTAFCGPALLSCTAATTYIGEPHNTFPTKYRTYCAWSGVVAASSSLTCEMTFQPGN